MENSIFQAFTPSKMKFEYVYFVKEKVKIFGHFVNV